MDLETTLRATLRDFDSFTQANGITLRAYQRQVANTIARSVFKNLGLTIVVIFPRQSGKNELQAQIETYLLTLFSLQDAEIVKVSPTWKPQSLNAMRRLERTIKRGIMSELLWSKEQGYIHRLDKARIYFLSAHPGSNIVGATANLLLECDEAQDIGIEKFDREISPMAASTNATRVFWGTAWTSQTLLAREKRAALKAQEQDGIQRVFHITADQVSEEVPAYRKFVQSEIHKLGRNHPFIKTQYYSEEIDAQGGMFPYERQAAMQGNHPPIDRPETGKLYAAAIDIAGQDETATSDPAASLSSTDRRDSTALTIFEIDLSALDNPAIRAPIYRVVYRRLWTGTKHTALYSRLRQLLDIWNPMHIIIDATGIGETITSFLDKEYPGKVIPFKFTTQSKSQLGWNFIALVETGRYQEYTIKQRPNTPAQAYLANLQTIFWQQCTACQIDILPGPGKLMKWSVPDGTRDPESGDYIHDDLIISAALCSELDGLTWGTAQSAIVQAYDPIQEMTF